VRVDELDYELPEELIAQAPPEARDGARLLVLDRGVSGVAHRAVVDLPSLLPPSLVVLNDTRVFPARLFGRKESGGKVELLLVERLGAPGEEERWLALGKASKGLRPGMGVAIDGGGLSARVEARRPDGSLEVTLRAEAGEVLTAIERVGRVPLPPYVARDPDARDRERYQTVFARELGAVAAPTAGLHLSERLLAALEAAGHRVAHVTLHVGPGTFAPVKVEDLGAHPMHFERYEVSEAAATALAEARHEGRPILAVGTTVVRTLEAAADAEGRVPPGKGRTDLFIRPPYGFRVVDSLLTNFHLPRSTLLALVMAFGGVEPVREAYAEAVRARYRFFSYGDAMLLRGAP